MNIKQIFYSICAFLFMTIGTQLDAQVTIGANKAPEKFSILELVSSTKPDGTTNLGGLRLPQLTEAQRDSLTVELEQDNTSASDGLLISIVTEESQTNHLEYWDGDKWVPIAVGPWQISDESGFIDDVEVPDNVYHTGTVQIGHNSPVIKSAILDIQPENNDKGMLIPRLTESERDSIDSPVNSLLIYNTDEGCVDEFDSISNQWKSLCSGVTRSEFTSNCDEIKVFGTCIQGVPLNSSNYVILTAYVTKAGTYNISATTTNGYGYNNLGTFLHEGTQQVLLRGQGTPINVSQNPGDAVVLVLNGEDTSCSSSIFVPVMDPKATYSINCGTIKLNGSYVKGTALNPATNTITMSVNVSDISSGGSWSVTTNTVNGISFAATGTFTATGTQTITLYGAGTPTVNADISLDITANTASGNANCSIVVPITLLPMTYAIIGSTDYSWITYRASALAAAASGSTGAFGPNGVVRISKLEQLWSTTDVNVAANNLNNGYNGKQPDVVLYFSHGSSPNSTIAAALSNYVNKGGCLIFGTTDNDRAKAQILLDGIFGANAALMPTSNAISDDNNYLINNNLVNDPLVNGPFGNLAGKYWGEDNSGSVYVTQLPPNSIQICSAYNLYQNINLNEDVSIIWYNDGKNFVYFGDSTAAMWDTDTSTGAYPTLFNQATGMPKSKVYGHWASSTSGDVTIVNSALEFNALSWCLHKAAISGINPH